MPRMSKKRKHELSFYLNDRGRVTDVYKRQVIDSRYCKMLPLIVTTNLGLNEMKSADLDTAHQRIYSRILEMCEMCIRDRKERVKNEQ